MPVRFRGRAAPCHTAEPPLSPPGTVSPAAALVVGGLDRPEKCWSAFCSLPLSLALSDVSHGCTGVVGLGRKTAGARLVSKTILPSNRPGLLEFMVTLARPGQGEARTGQGGGRFGSVVHVLTPSLADPCVGPHQHLTHSLGGSGQHSGQPSYLARASSSSYCWVCASGNTSVCYSRPCDCGSRVLTDLKRVSLNCLD